jgi:hypothetical protein
LLAIASLLPLRRRREAAAVSLWGHSAAGRSVGVRHGGILDDPRRPASRQSAPSAGRNVA